MSTSRGSVTENEQEAAPLQQKGGRAWQTFGAGAVSGMMTSLALQPLDVVRTHLQAAPRSPSGQSRTWMSVVRSIVAERGFEGLWRGTGPTMIRIGFGAGLYFSLLDHVLVLLRPTASASSNQLPAGVTMAAGALTRGIAAAALCPITVVKTRMEFSGVSGPRGGGTLLALSAIAKTEGVRGLFSGLGVTLLRDAPYSALYLLFYARLRTLLHESVLQKRSPQSWSNLAAGGMAGAAATVATHPADVVRTLLQLEGAPSSSMAAVIRSIYKEQGVVGFFRGVGPRVTKRALQQALTWTIYEELVRNVSGISLWGDPISK